jgi:hypothetical protein
LEAPLHPLHAECCCIIGPAAALQLPLPPQPAETGRTEGGTTAPAIDELLLLPFPAGVAKLAKQKQQGGAVVLQPQQGDTSLPAAVTITVPFEATVLVPPPPGRAKWSCDLLFRDTKVRCSVS